MKKIFTIIVLAALTLTAFAQNDIKRVAILETVDKEGTVPYLKRLMFRSNLTTAITNTAGYEGYDRADLSQILGEQDFQRTGLVSDADIKKIGEFTGAKYVLIAEAVIDGNDMFITAKIIDVETARVLRNSNQLMGTSAAEMQNGSIKVAADLLGASNATPARQAAALKNAKNDEEQMLLDGFAKGYIKCNNLYVTIPCKQADSYDCGYLIGYCSAGGYSDWRLPTMSELNMIKQVCRNLYDNKENYPMIPAGQMEQLKEIFDGDSFWADNDYIVWKNGSYTSLNNKRIKDNDKFGLILVRYAK